MINPGAAGRALLGAFLGELPEDFDLPRRVGPVPGGLLAFDDAQLTLNWIGLARGMPGQPVAQGQIPAVTLLFYEFEITLLRLVSGPSGRGKEGGIPSMERLGKEYDVLASTDGVAVENALRAVHVGGLVVPVEVPFAYGPVSAIGPEGKLAGCRAPVSFQAGCASDGESY